MQDPRDAASRTRNLLSLRRNLLPKKYVCAFKILSSDLCTAQLTLWDLRLQDDGQVAPCPGLLNRTQLSVRKIDLGMRSAVVRVGFVLKVAPSRADRDYQACSVPWTHFHSDMH